jgi:hypothetical protein
MIRYGFLEAGVGADEKNAGETYTASEQVAKINEYLWDSGRWFYFTLQAGARYKLENGWGAGVTFRVGLPMANFWDDPIIPFIDTMHFSLALLITPPVKIVAPKDRTEEPLKDWTEPDAPAETSAPAGSGDKPAAGSTSSPSGTAPATAK